MNNRIRLWIGITIPVLLILIVSGIFFWRNASSGSGTTQPQGQQKLTKVRLALDWTPNTNHTGIYVALKQKWYQQQGIDLQILPYSSSVTPDTLVAQGNAEIGIGFTEGIVSDAAAKAPVVSIGAIMQHNTSALITLADSGINSPRDLDGKIYGGFGAPYEEPVISQVIKHDGGKGQFRNIPLDVDAVDALKAHRIDFAWVYQGWEVLQAEREGMKLNVFPIVNYGIPDYYTPLFIASQNEIKGQPDLLRRFMAATARGYEYAGSHPGEAAQMLIDTAPKGTFPDPGLVTASQTYVSPRYSDPGHKWGLQDAQVWHGYPEFILKSGGITDASGKVVTRLDTSIDDLYTNQFLP
ncbi:MAG: ABC transporter substrate-binding protein [Ktedonobacteraceae bacterium]|nr:ABC transporter substrate-binding protein [Ktedonobacteraceae bacterium]MBO0792145.1 ABC transporter substrate-binding protein [Ktedonobacteraceae bacterium]